MKKKVIVIMSVVALILGSVTALAANNIQISDFKDFFDKSNEIQSNEMVLAVVNGDKIYESNVDFQLEFSKLSYSLAVEQIDKMNIPMAQKQELLKQQKESQKTEEEILDDLIKEAVLLQEAKKQGISVSDEEARSFALEQYTILKELALTSSESSLNSKNYEFIRQYMEKMDLTEEQYIDKTTAIYKKLLIINKFYETAVPSGNDLEGELNNQNYVDSLVNQAEIVYIK